MNKAQFLYIITSLWKLCGVYTLILLKITMILKSCLTNSTCAQAFSRKNSLTFLWVSKSAKGFLTDVVGDNSLELNFNTYITRRAFSIMYMLMLLKMIKTRKGFVTHITQKRAETSVHTLMLPQVTVNTKCFVTYITSI